MNSIYEIKINQALNMTIKRGSNSFEKINPHLTQQKNKNQKRETIISTRPTNYLCSQEKNCSKTKY